MSRKKNTKTRTLTLFLLKEPLEKFEDALETDDLTRYDLRTDLDFPGALFVRASHSHKASWVDFVEQGTQREVRNARSQSSASVLILKAKGRHFAFTFGFGQSLLKGEAYEPEFGLRVAVNLVDASKLRSVDARTVEELTIYTRKQTSRSATLGTFGLDVSHDMLRAVTGEPRDKDCALRVTGKDALIFTKKVTFNELGASCEKFLQAHRKKDYKESFSFIDRITHVRDAKAIEDLDGLLVEALQRRSLARLHMAPPDIVDWDKLHEFRYVGSAKRHQDLDPESFLAAEGGDLSVERLKNGKIHGYQEGEESPLDSWPAYRCLVFEAKIRGESFVLSGGLWYRIAKEFSEKVDADLAKIKISTLALPDARPDQDEGSYNEMAAEDPRFLLLDKKLVKSGGATTRMEVCDLASKEGHLVHVKRHMRSSTLSHLVAQGLNSAQALIGDVIFRKAARRLATGGFEHLFPDNPPSPSKYEITFAIIAKNDPTFPKNLPFFSQLSLTRAAEILRRQQLRVAIKLIPLQDD